MRGRGRALVSGSSKVALGDSVFTLADFEIEVLTNHDFDHAKLSLGHAIKCARCGVGACLKSRDGVSWVEFTPATEHGSISSCNFTWKNPYWRESFAALAHVCEVIWTMALRDALLQSRFNRVHLGKCCVQMYRDDPISDEWEVYVNEAFRVGGKSHGSFNAAFIVLCDWLRSSGVTP